MNLSQVCIIIVFILPLVALEKKAFEDHSDYQPFYTEMTTEQCRKYISDQRIKKELMARRARVTTLKTKTETEMNNLTTDAPSTTGSSQDIYKLRSDFRNPSHGLRS